MQQNRGIAMWWIIGLVAVAVIVFFAFRHKAPQYQSQPPAGQVEGDTAATSQKLVLEGTVVCLPHRNATGPTTMECAYGIKTDDGKYYGLDTSGLPATQPPEYNVGDRISVEGTLIPQDQMPANFWNTYNVTGLIAMQTFWKFTDK